MSLLDRLAEALAAAPGANHRFLMHAEGRKHLERQVGAEEARFLGAALSTTDDLALVTRCAAGVKGCDVTRRLYLLADVTTETVDEDGVVTTTTATECVAQIPFGP